MAFTFSIEADPEALGRDANNADFKITNPNILALSAQAPLTAGTKKVTVKAVEGVTGEFGYGYFDVVINPAITSLDFTQSFTPSAPSESQGTPVGTFSVNGGTGPYTYTLVAGTGDTDNGSYQISGSTLQVGASPTLTDPTDSIRVRVEDSTGYQLEQQFQLDVYPVGGTATVACDGTPNTLYDDDVDGDAYCNLEATTTPQP